MGEIVRFVPKSERERARLVACRRHLPAGVERAGYYSTAPLEQTLVELVDVDLLNSCSPRARHHHEIDWTIAHDLISDAHVAAQRVPCYR
jgi:hypothetical protein